MNKSQEYVKANRALKQYQKDTRLFICGAVVFLVLVITPILAAPANADEFDIKEYLNKTHVTIGAGYKVQETSLEFTRDGVTTEWSEPVSARIEVYYQYSDNVTFGISHHSQWLTGWPVNSEKEYSKTEIFIDYTFSVGSLF